MTHLTKTPTV